MEEISQLTKKLIISEQRYPSEDVLIKEILTKLPVKSVMRLKSVSKRWLTEISSNSFIADHFHYHSTANKPSDLAQDTYEHKLDKSYTRNRLCVIDESDKIAEIDISYVTPLQNKNMTWFLLASSNGLVLVEPFCRTTCEIITPVLLNPATREFVTLPRPIAPAASDPEIHYFNYSFGFGEDCMNYKIVRVANHPHSYSIRVQVFTKNSGRWREVGTVLECQFQFNRNGGAVIDGLINWAIFEDGLNKILTFDLNTELLKVIDGPVCQSEQEYKELEVIKWKGRLCALMISKVTKEFHFWSKNLVGWTKMFVFKPPVSVWSTFEGVLRDELAFFIDSSESFLYDPVTHKITPFPEDVSPGCFRHYLPSLISPTYY